MRWISASKLFVTALPALHQKTLAALAALLLIAALLPSGKEDTAAHTLSLDHLIDTEAPVIDSPELSIRQLKAPWAFDEVPESETLLVPAVAQGGNSYQYIVRKGDTLSSIFERLQLPQKTMYQLLEADLNVLALDNLMPGHTLVFEKEEHQLKRFELQFNLAHKVVYQRKEAEGFEFEEVRLEGDWKESLVQGEILYTFTGSGQKAGLSKAEAQSITQVLKQRVDFRRDIQRGDKFEVLVTRQYVDGEATGNTQVQAIRIKNRHNISAFLFEDNYYDEKGRNLEKAFQRYPFNGKYRLSSHYNPRRRHPVTGLIRPHNGTDFAMRKGSPVVSTGDGVVSRVVRHKYAGLYIEIKHGQSYKTRYLHLNKSYVIKGQRVKRGQKIAQSGNSGRSTGPHLHFELHKNGRPVNAMTAKIPIAVSLTGKKKNAFKRQLKSYLAKIEASSLEQLALNEKNRSSDQPTTL
ncbi:peptidoglycan DD-metalloendopeptidase family protein [uncultured Neptuniibacter sp.]|uniref:peptidoglycan DD-metalloendopeptidase family protein n=1 Tax=uncultured Neptuniibacter sp. TaxID=502143 RepID=UPI00261861B2|nr:peptidoglycan DD-metalloendopeptidase family protein [uncultured Neptuniibacter sp.]